MNRSLQHGSWVALVTPFANGSIDDDAVNRLLDLHLEAGTDGLVICGTTGEAVTLTTPEKEHLMRLVTKRVGKRIAIMLGTGSNSTTIAVEATRRAADWGAQAVLVVTPYYNKPTQEGLNRHFREVAAATPLPLVLYNVPGRTGVNMLPATVLALAGVETIVAVKEASGNVLQAMEILRDAPPGFLLFSGEDALNLPLMAVGAVGTISVTANVEPRRMKRFNDACLASRWEEAKRLHDELLPLHRGLFLESNPSPVKAALALRGHCRPDLRLPLVEVTSATREALAAILRPLDEE